MRHARVGGDFTEESPTQLTPLGWENSGMGNIQQQYEQHPLRSYLGVLEITEMALNCDPRVRTHILPYICCSL